MDYLPNLETLSLWLVHYGSFTLFILLALGIIALPIPEETLMIIAGVLMQNNKLAIIPTILAAIGGSMVGITVSYLLGVSVGAYFLHQYGKYIGLTEKRLENVHGWFARFGKWTLVIGYFIPGVRHLTGFCAGSSALKYKHFACFAYFGACLWVSCFLSIGYFFGDYGLTFLENFNFPLDEVATLILFAIILLFLVYVFYHFNKQKRK